MSFEDDHEGLYQPRLWSNLHLWREILLNARPNVSCELFQGRRRQTYWLEVNHSQTGVTLIVYRRGGPVARAVVKWDGHDEAVLDDLLVISSCRNRWLATCLLNRTITLSRQHGAKRLTGRVIHKDAERNPALLDWYQRRSFKVEPVLAVPLGEPKRPLSKVAQRAQLDFETVAKISLDLDTALI